jgi:hypothetical protein
VKIDDLPIHMRLKRGECRQKINGFENTGLALRITSYQNSSPPWKFNVQAGEAAKVGEGEMFEMHREVKGYMVESQKSNL